MTWKSIDQLQKDLTKDVFQYAKDSKKAAGRALGTIVEIITYYILRDWGLNESVSIERQIPEFGNPDIKHNVEFSLHPVLNSYSLELEYGDTSITSNRILKALGNKIKSSDYRKTTNVLLTKDGVLRNGCIIASSERSYLVASLTKVSRKKVLISVAEQTIKPYAIFECKRVGVEEGTRKGPQTIEKAKQGAYVARTVSSLQKVRLRDGSLYGILYTDDGVPYTKPYNELLSEIINSSDGSLLEYFVLTVGVVSNHGNWFTGDDHNKELKVLSQSYDWLIFLTDEGITQFVRELIIQPSDEYLPVKKAFLTSYSKNKLKNQFTKVKMNLDAHIALTKYFSKNRNQIEKWFNVISPKEGTLVQLKQDIKTLQSKNWGDFLE